MRGHTSRRSQTAPSRLAIQSNEPTHRKAGSPARRRVAGDRLHRADYAFAFAAENIARSTSLWEAMASLMRSPGHRRNLLSPEVTHGGIGVAIATDAHGERTYLVTQVFARPAPRESPRRPGASPRREVP